jgi:threonine dehydrogenase-like Zn-dependent dehydrogenase
MIQAQLVAPRTFELIELPTLEPGAAEVLIQVACVAVCGSEFAPYLGLATEFPLYKGVARYPRTVGHEASGLVQRVGAGVGGFAPGQAVAPRAALFATHALARAEDLVLVPDGMSLERASLALMGQETYYLCHEMLRIEPIDRVLIVGLGPFGMLCLEHAREIGCRTLIATDLQAGRLDLARDLGATRTFNASQVDLVQAIQEMGVPPSVVIECSGQPKPIQQAIRVAGAHGRIALAGRPSRPLQDFTIEDVFHNLLTVMGGKVPAAGYTPRYRSIVLEMIRDQRIHADRHITHVLPLDRVGDAFEIAIDPARGGLKVVVDCRQTRSGQA